jgi:predicted amidophosphoribosyltransferase
MCRICGQQIATNDRCANRLCFSADRQFGWSVPIAMRVGELERAINAWKDNKKWGWGLILGRVLLGYLQDNRERFDQFDLIISSPSYRGASYDPRYDYTAFMLSEAQAQDDSGLPFVTDQPVIIRTRPLRRMRETRGYSERQDIARDLRTALHVTRPQAVAGRSVLVFDDVFTTGHSVNETARALRAAGARMVCQVVLARQPWPEYRCPR